MRITLRNPKQNEKRDDSRDADDRLRDLPKWLEEFTNNLEDKELHAPAHISQDSDSELPTIMFPTADGTARGAILSAGKQKSGAVIQSFKSLLG